MSASDVDFYVVQNMVEGEARDRRAADNDLRDGQREAIQELWTEIGELRDNLTALERVLNSRTEHLT